VNYPKTCQSLFHVLVLIFVNSLLAKQINTEVLWSQSADTKDILTPFAEGLCCRIYDSHCMYSSVYVGTNTWYVVSKSALEPQASARYTGGNPSFVHVRTVSIKDGFMICDCQQYINKLMPCNHMATVFASCGKVFSATHFHLRYWKHFMYYSDRTWCEVDELRNIDKLMNEIQEKCYIDGVYRGIHVGCEFEDVLKDKEITVHTDTILIQTQRIITAISENGCLVSHSDQHHLCIDLSSRFSVLQLEDENIVGDFGGGTTTITQASSYHDFSMTLPDDNYNASDLVTQEMKHKRLYGKFIRLLNSISTTDELDDCDAELELMLAKRSNGSTLNLDVFNDDGAPGRLEKRHKSFWEL
jgi:hypothetical protein